MFVGSEKEPSPTVVELVVASISDRFSPPRNTDHCNPLSGNRPAIIGQSGELRTHIANPCFPVAPNPDFDDIFRRDF